MALYTHTQRARAQQNVPSFCGGTGVFHFVYKVFIYFTFSNFPQMVYRTFYLTSCLVAIVHHAEMEAEMPLRETTRKKKAGGE